MSNRITVARGLAFALVLGACQEAGTPTDPAQRNLAPSFVVDPGGAGGGQALEPGLSAQQINMQSGSDFTCVGTVTGVFDNIVVPPGALCVVANAVVRGNVKALQDAVLVVALSQVGGSIYGDKADVVQLRNNTIQGNIDIVEGGPHPVFREVALCGNTLPNGNIKAIKMVGGVDMSLIAFCAGLPVPNVLAKGSIQVEDNVITPNRWLFINSNSVGANLQVYKTREAGSIIKAVTANTARESVQCFDNDPPFVGGPNVAPKREGQCF
jgi:hypothetical protein